MWPPSSVAESHSPMSWNSTAQYSTPGLDFFSSPTEHVSNGLLDPPRRPLLSSPRLVAPGTPAHRKTFVRMGVEGAISDASPGDKSRQSIWTGGALPPPRSSGSPLRLSQEGGASAQELIESSRNRFGVRPTACRRISRLSPRGPRCACGSARRAGHGQDSTRGRHRPDDTGSCPSGRALFAGFSSVWTQLVVKGAFAGLLA